MSLFNSKVSNIKIRENSRYKKATINRTKQQIYRKKR